MIKLVIVDDEANQIELVRDCINQFFPQIKIVGTAHSVPDAERLIRQTQPDLVFSDIDMPPNTGFDLLQRFDQISFGVVFITGFDKYAVRAFEVAAVDYLVKPVSPEALKRAIEKFEKESERKQSAELLKVLMHNYQVQHLYDMRITLPRQHGYDVIKIKNIIRIEGDGNYSRFFLDDKTERLAAKQLGLYEKALADFNFFRVHKSNIINLLHVKGYSTANGHHVMMSDGCEIEIARGRKDEFLLRLKSF